MTVTPQPAEVRQIVARTFLEFQVNPAIADEMDERIRIDQGKYVARAYRVEGFMAMWLVDLGIVQFYDEDGNMLRTVNLLQELHPRRMAA